MTKYLHAKIPKRLGRDNGVQYIRNILALLLSYSERFAYKHVYFGDSTDMEISCDMLVFLGKEIIYLLAHI